VYWNIVAYEVEIRVGFDEGLDLPDQYRVDGLRIPIRHAIYLWSREKGRA